MHTHTLSNVLEIERQIRTWYSEHRTQLLSRAIIKKGRSGLGYTPEPCLAWRQVLSLFDAEWYHAHLYRQVAVFLYIDITSFIAGLWNVHSGADVEILESLWGEQKKNFAAERYISSHHAYWYLRLPGQSQSMMNTVCCSSQNPASQMAIRSGVFHFQAELCKLINFAILC